MRRLSKKVEKAGGLFKTIRSSSKRIVVNILKHRKEEQIFLFPIKIGEIYGSKFTNSRYEVIDICPNGKVKLLDTRLNDERYAISLVLNSRQFEKIK